MLTRQINKWWWLNLLRFCRTNTSPFSLPPLPRSGTLNPAAHPSLRHTQPCGTPIPEAHPSLRHTHPWGTLNPAAHPSLRHTHPCSTPIPEAHSTLRHTNPWGTLNPEAHPSLSKILMCLWIRTISDVKIRSSKVRLWGELIADKGFEKTVYLLEHAVLSFEILVIMLPIVVK